MSGVGWSGTIQLPPGRAAASVFARHAEIASAFNVHSSSVILSPTRTEREVHIEVYERNPLQSAARFTGPTLDAAEGTCVIGHDTMGAPAHWRFWRPGWGACHGLVFGTSGAGKSALLSMLMTEARHSGLAVPWFLDPEEGLSAPAWIEAADFYAGTDEDGSIAPIRDALRRLERVWRDRRQTLAAERRTWTGPTPDMPLIFTVVDEAPDVLADPESARILKWLLRKGRKAGVAVVLIAQVPSLAELGGDQTIRSQAAGVNVVAFRTSDKMSASMGMPKVLPVDPVTLPEEWPDGSTTAGLAYLGGGRMVRTSWLRDDDAWTWAQSGIPADLGESAARAAGGRYLEGWLRRHGRDGEADAVRDEPAAEQVANVTALDPAEGGLRERLVQLVAEVGTATTGVLHSRVADADGRPALASVSKTLRRAAERGEIRDLGHARWGAADRDDPAHAGREESAL